MRYAETGFNLEVDLTRGNIERVATDPKLTELHLGGLGTNARLFWDRVPPEVGALRSREPARLRHRAAGGHARARLQPHHRLGHLAADAAVRLLDDGRLLRARS